jgi:hypothetical protein
LPVKVASWSRDIQPVTFNLHLAITFMAHIHEKIDSTVAIFVVHGSKLLLIHRRKLDKWLPMQRFP